MATNQLLQESLGDVPRFMMTGRIMALAGEDLVNFQEAMILAQNAQIACRKAQLEILNEVIKATESQGLLQSLGSEISGTLGCVGGGLAIGGGAIGLYGAFGEGAELGGLVGPEEDVVGNAVAEMPGAGQIRQPNEIELVDMGNVGNDLQVDAVAADAAPEAAVPERLSDAERDLQRGVIEAKYKPHATATQLGQIVSQFCQSAGQLGNAPLQAAGAKEQADAKMAETMQSSVAQLLSSSESAAQNSKSAFDQALGMFAQIAQSNVLLAQAH